MLEGLGRSVPVQVSAGSVQNQKVTATRQLVLHPQRILHQLVLR
jgi:ABC-type methionine transport system ATPase subunit